jgi:hypothetical protein
MLTFPVALVKDATNVLRHAGFRFSKVKPDWEGLAHFADAESLATAHGGTARRVAASTLPPNRTPSRQKPLTDRTSDLRSAACRAASCYPALAAVAVLVYLSLLDNRSN